ncbi:hypothetical protein [Streptomyces sp. NBC_01602]|uniref:hypothetical protein n=1 Tax=Streptomyces sp. NBC_01602 TaxID=2975893 RepID=UPI0038698904
MREADHVGESRTDLVLGNHHDLTSVLLRILDDRQIRAVRFVSVTVVMAENAAALDESSVMCGGYEVNESGSRGS